MPGIPKRKARLMRWQNTKGMWFLTLWIPFHGQWPLASHAKKSMFDRKAKQLVAALGLEVEDVGGTTNV